MNVNTKLPVLIFVSGVFISSVVYSSSLLDFTLLPRLLAIAITVNVLLAYLLYNAEKIKFEFNLLYLVYSLYMLYACVTVFWSNTKSESYFENSKQILFFLCFITTAFLLQQHQMYFEKYIHKVSQFVAVLVLFFFGIQYYNLSSTHHESLYTLTGINGHKNLISSFLFINLFFLIWGALTNQGKSKLFLLLLIAVSLISLFLLKTKAVWLAMVISAFVYILVWILLKLKLKVLDSKRIWIYTLLILLAINSFLLFGLKPILEFSLHYGNTLQTASGFENEAVKLESERLVLWLKTLEVIKSHPLLGVGLGNWQIEFPNTTLSDLWRAEDLNYTFQRPHNDLLWIVSETGLIGFNLFSGFLVLLLLLIFNRIIELHQNEKSYFFWLIGLCCIIGYYALSFFDFPRERAEHSVWINILLGVFVVYLDKQTKLPLTRYVTVNKKAIFLLLCVSSLLSYIQFQRLKSEYYTRKLYDYKNSGLTFDVITSGKKIINTFYSIDPTSVPIQWYTGNAQASLGNYKEALNDFQAAFLLTPYNRNVVNDLASAYAMQGEVALAKKYYLEASRISPRFDDPKLNLVAIYIQEKKYEEAQACLNSVMHDSERRTEYQNFITSAIKK